MVIDKYLSRYALLPVQPKLDGHWQHVMVVPCFRESPDFLKQIPEPPTNQALLVICVLNRPAAHTDPGVNSTLRSFITERARSTPLAGLALCPLAPHTDLLMVDLEHLEGPTPRKEGVGRARRIGCDLALWLIQQGKISAAWIHSCDADARWPSNYLSESWPAEATGVSLPFQHVMNADSDLGRATLVYELWMHHYVLGLEWARSPYAFHTLGSCCGFSAHGYAAVRGVPLRAGAEDFYLLNKLAKVGRIHRPSGPPVFIQARASDRVPFGTGPAVTRLMATTRPETVPFFYHLDCFSALKRVLELFPIWLESQNLDISHDLSISLPSDLAASATSILLKLGLSKAISHAKHNGNDSQQRLRQLHTWFDGFRTLKFLNGLRDLACNHQTFEQIQDSAPMPATSGDLIARRNTIIAAWGWQPETGNTPRFL